MKSLLLSMLCFFLLSNTSSYCSDSTSQKLGWFPVLRGQLPILRMIGVIKNNSNNQNSAAPSSSSISKSISQEWVDSQNNTLISTIKTPQKTPSPALPAAENNAQLQAAAAIILSRATSIENLSNADNSNSSAISATNRNNSSTRQRAHTPINLDAMPLLAASEYPAIDVDQVTENSQEQAQPAASLLTHQNLRKMTIAHASQISTRTQSSNSIHSRKSSESPEKAHQLVERALRNNNTNNAASYSTQEAHEAGYEIGLHAIDRSANSSPCANSTASALQEQYSHGATTNTPTTAMSRQNSNDSTTSLLQSAIGRLNNQLQRNESTNSMSSTSSDETISSTDSSDVIDSAYYRYLACCPCSCIKQSSRNLSRSKLANEKENTNDNSSAAVQLQRMDERTGPAKKKVE